MIWHCQSQAASQVAVCFADDKGFFNSLPNIGFCELVGTPGNTTHRDEIYFAFGAEWIQRQSFMWKMLATDRVHIVKPVDPARSATYPPHGGANEVGRIRPGPPTYPPYGGANEMRMRKRNPKREASTFSVCLRAKHSHFICSSPTGVKWAGQGRPALPGKMCAAGFALPLVEPIFWIIDESRSHGIHADVFCLLCGGFDASQSMIEEVPLPMNATLFCKP